MAQRQKTRVPGGDRGEETRQRLLEAAIDVFGRRGYEGASTRALAGAAGANLAAIPYHFGSKEGLYLAAAAHIAEQIGGRMGPVAERIAAELTGGAGDRALCLHLLHDFLDRFAELVLLEAEAGRWARFIMREQMDPTRAFEILYGSIMKRVLGLVGELIGRLTGAPADSEATRLEALVLIGQILVFRTARAAVLRQMDWSVVGPRELAAIQAVLREKVAAIADARAGHGDA